MRVQARVRIWVLWCLPRRVVRIISFKILRRRGEVAATAACRGPLARSVMGAIESRSASNQRGYVGPLLNFFIAARDSSEAEVMVCPAVDDPPLRTPFFVEYCFVLSR